MSLEAPQSGRELQAQAEIGRTSIGGPVAVGLVLLFLATLVSSGAYRAISGRGDWTPFTRLAADVQSAAGAISSEGFLRTDRLVLRAFHDFEEALEESSPWRHALLAPIQGALTRWGGVGNEQAIVGRDGWLFFRPDVEAVTGPPFLDPARMEARRRAGDVWEPRPNPDPLDALVALREALAERRVDLVVLPIPTKAALEGHRLSRRVGSGEVFHNLSWSRWLAAADAAGIEILDPTPILESARGEAENVFLARDTHWQPSAMEAVAAALATRIEPLLSPPPADFYLSRRTAVVDGVGDLSRMLEVSENSLFSWPERVTVHPVLDSFGGLYLPGSEGAVLVLGDSFANVFSDEALGWGAGAGLAEQLAFSLQRPVRRVARNAGGAWQSRAALRERPGVLDGVRVAIYEFSARELSFGDWRAVDLPEAGPLSTQ